MSLRTAFEGEGQWVEYEGGYEDYLIQKFRDDWQLINQDLSLVRHPVIPSPDRREPAIRKLDKKTAGN